MSSLDFDVVVCRSVGNAFFLSLTSVGPAGCALDRVGTVEYERYRFTRMPGPRLRVGIRNHDDCSKL